MKSKSVKPPEYVSKQTRSQISPRADIKKLPRKHSSASKHRTRKKMAEEELNQTCKRLTEEQQLLQTAFTSMTNQRMQLKQLLMEHCGCNSTPIDCYHQRVAAEISRKHAMADPAGNHIATAAASVVEMLKGLSVGIDSSPAPLNSESSLATIEGFFPINTLIDFRSQSEISDNRTSYTAFEQPGERKHNSSWPLPYSFQGQATPMDQPVVESFESVPDLERRSSSQDQQSVKEEFAKTAHNTNGQISPSTPVDSGPNLIPIPVLGYAPLSHPKLEDGYLEETSNSLASFYMVDEAQSPQYTMINHTRPLEMLL